MSDDNESGNFKMFLGLIVASLVFGYYSLIEFRYLAFGQKADAAVVSAHETVVMGTKGRRKTKLQVDYSFADGAAPRQESDTTAIDAPITAGSTVAIEFLPGVAGRSRLVSNRNMIMVYLFAGVVLFLGFQGFSLFQEARKATSKPSPRSAEA
ncbi:MAG: hypothetical protein IT428_14760 [Planctomycetaceae bacterium]|nr:hypothetical protein [Planctomycetaceae bacterium]